MSLKARLSWQKRLRHPFRSRKDRMLLQALLDSRQMEENNRNVVRHIILYGRVLPPPLPGEPGGAVVGL